MKAKELCKRLRTNLELDLINHSRSKYSKVDETRTTTEMLAYWVTLLDVKSDKNVGSILLYNIEKDFPNAFRNNEYSRESFTRMLGSK